MELKVLDAVSNHKGFRPRVFLVRITRLTREQSIGERDHGAHCRR